MKAAWAKLDAFLRKYSGWVHIFLTIWNLLVTGWATKLPINLSQIGAEIGIPLPAITINVATAVSWIQANTHLPTWLLGVVTLAVNATIGYSAWKKNHVQEIDVKEGDAVIVHPTDADVPTQKVDLVVKPKE